MRIKIPDKQPAGFGRLAKYMTGQSRHLSPERVDWAMERNLGTTNPDVAALAMESVADQSTRCKQPAYHLIIAFDKNDAAKGKVSKEVMQTIAVRALERLGLAEHQALICAHRDTDHPHMHILANRVHPVTGKALTMSFDKVRMLEFAQEQAQAFGLNMPRDRLKERELEPRAKDGEYRQAGKEGRLPDLPYKPDELKALQKEVWADLSDAKSWDELTGLLHAKGYTLHPKGQGLMITDGTKTAKLSDLGKTVRMKLLEQRFQESFLTFAARRARSLATARDQGDDMAVSDKAPDDVRSLSAKLDRARELADLAKAHPVDGYRRADGNHQYWSELYGYYQHLENRRKGHPARFAGLNRRGVKADALVEKREKTFTDGLGRVYRNPKEAKEAWERLARGQGEDRAAELVKNNPTLLGTTVVDLKGPRVTERQKAAARAYGMLRERRSKLVEAQNELRDVIAQLDIEQRQAKLAAKEYEAIKKHVGAPEIVKEILLEKAKMRDTMLSRLNARLIEQADVTEEQRQRMHKAWRQYNERKRAREREAEYRSIPRNKRGRDRGR